jgi:hypothetical protein
MNDLFSEDPQFRRVQYTKLSDSVQAWPQEIAALVSEHLPSELGLDVSIVFQKVDQQKGYAIGTAIVRHPNAPKQVGIPIIVKAWHVAPFDLFFQDNALHPLTDDALARAFFSANIGAGLAPVKPPPQLQDDQGFENRFPPIGGKYASVAEAIVPVRDVADIAALRAAVEVNPHVLGKFAAHRTFELLQKWAAKKDAQEPELDADRAARIVTVKKDAPDRYRVWANNDEVFDPVLIHLDRQGLQGLLELRKARLAHVPDPMQNLDRNGELTLPAPDDPYNKPLEGPKGSGVDGSGSYGAELGPRRNAFVFDPLADDRAVVQADKCARYGVTDKSGVLAKGWVLPHVVSFDGKAAGMKLFVSGALWAMQSRIAGVPLGDEPTITLPTGELETGKMGTLVHREGDRSVATVPFTVLGVTVYEGQESVAIADYRGARMNLLPSARVDGILPVKDSKMLGPLLGPGRNYLVSAKMLFVPLGKLTSVSENGEAFRKLAAETVLDATPLKVSMANGRYLFRGAALGKYAAAGILGGTAGVLRRGRNLAIQVALKSADATRKVRAMVEKAAFDPVALERHEAEFLLSSWGLGHDKVAEVLDGARSRVVLEVHHLRYPELPSLKKTATPRAAALVQRMRSPMALLVKTAALLEDADTVDAVLSLGFVNPENVSRFAAIRPMLEEASDALAKLLLAARLGMEDVPEEAVRSAIVNLQRVLDGLSRLRMLAEQEQASPTARGRAA